MFDMFFTDVTDLAVSSPQAATAIATSDLVSVTFGLVLVTAALVFVGFLIGLLQVGVVWHGIKKMIASNDTRNEHHKQAVDDEAKRHKKAMKAETRRHKEAMQAQAQRHQESMTALHALIRNTSPGPA